jgi:hypothetical protein
VGVNPHNANALIATDAAGSKMVAISILMLFQPKSSRHAKKSCAVYAEAHDFLLDYYFLGWNNI